MHGILLSAFGLFVLLTFAVTGCSRSNALPPPPLVYQEGESSEAGVHVHSADGPHHGQLIELGNGEYHAEMVHEEATHLVGVYLLDANAKSAVPVPDSQLTLNLLVDGKPAQFQLAAAPLDGEPAQHSSYFQRTDHVLCAALDNPESNPRFNVSIKGKPFVGRIAEHHHTPHDTSKH